MREDDVVRSPTDRGADGLRDGDYGAQFAEALVRMPAHRFDDDPLIASRRLAAIVESSDDAIVAKDLNGVITSWNRAAARMFGYSADEAVGRSIRIIIPDDRQGEEDTILGRIRQGEAVDHFETIRRRKDGTTLPISLTISPIRDERGVVIGASKIARDITARKRLDEQTETEHRRTAFLERLTATLARSLDYEQTLKDVAALAVPHIADWSAVDVVDEEGEIKRLSVAHIDPAKVELAIALRDGATKRRPRRTALPTSSRRRRRP